LPFAMLALLLGQLISRLYHALQDWRWAWLLFLLPLVAFAHALYLYDRNDFLGLNVIRGGSRQMPPPWNPFTVQQPGWLLLPTFAVILAVTVRLCKRTRSKQSNARP
jgi:disulfide bond formation protein DsbB